MTNYNDGKWHGWDGGKCPVHPKSVGDLTYFDGTTYKSEKMGQLDWRIPVLFRVVKEHKEPREFWITNNDAFAHDSLEQALADPHTEEYGYIHVREVSDD